MLTRGSMREGVNKTESNRQQAITELGQRPRHGGRERSEKLSSAMMIRSSYNKRGENRKTKEEGLIPAEMELGVWCRLHRLAEQPE